MRKMRKLLSALSLAALLVGATACMPGTSAPESSSAAPIPALGTDQKVSIVLESYNYGLAGAWTDTFNTLIGEFHQAHPNIEVKAQKPQGNSPNPATDTISSIQNQIVAGTPPDVAPV